MNSTILILQLLLPKNICLSLLNMAVKNVEFSFNYYICKQIDGVAMGCPLGPILANIFLDTLNQCSFPNFQSQ